MKGKIMKLRTIFYGLTSGLLLGLSSCSLNYEPLDTYSDVTEGVTSDGTKIVFKDKAAADNPSYKLFLKNGFEIEYQNEEVVMVKRNL